MIAWLIRALVVSGVAAAAAYCFERALHNRGLATRFAWLFGVVASVVLPFVPRVAHAPDISVMIPAVPLLPALEIAAIPTAAQPGHTLPLTILFWSFLSAIALGVYAVAYARLRTARRAWRSASLEKHNVLVSQCYGPAVCGFRQPRIVVPAWVFDVSAIEQRLIVLHEAEHVRARDQLLVLASLVATIVMPWNPFIWLQIHRMRFALEADCDQRVLASAADRQQYASLLVDVGSRHSGLLLSPALAEQRHGLEKRIAIMARNVVRRRWAALAFALAGGFFALVSCESRLPTAAPLPRTDNRVEANAVAKERTDNRVFGEAEYPAELRAAGIGGTVGLRVHVTDRGLSDKAEVISSSGNAQLDAAALRAAQHAEWANEGPARHTDYWTTTSVTFHPDASMRPMQSDTPPPALTQKPVFTPYTKQPVLLNREEVQQALMQTYPPLLRDAGVGGTILVWVLLDETGSVFKSQIKEGSGHAELDQAALKVTETMKFSPALNRDQPVAAWIQLPIVFKSDAPTALNPPATSARRPTAARPVFTPYTVRPFLRNREEVARALVENYPPLLRKAGVGGQVLVWVFIDQNGDVINTALKTGSGHAELDEAALRVARTFKFIPAVHRDKPVAVWIQLPIVFKTQ